MANVVTYTGRQVNLLAPRPETIDVIDIAHALSHLCRFNGHTRAFYSVAEHSIRVAEQLPAPLRLVGLLHDATEAYLGDVIQPLKAILPGYVALEEAMWLVIAERFDLPACMPAAVGFADRLLLATERRDLIMPTEHPWPSVRGIEPLRETINPLTPDEAQDIFLRLFDRYTTSPAVRGARWSPAVHSSVGVCMATSIAG